VLDPSRPPPYVRPAITTQSPFLAERHFCRGLPQRRDQLINQRRQGNLCNLDFLAAR
jgi:hypothetical protein